MRLVAFTIFLMTFQVAPALAQVDLSGMWAGRFHEDQEHRVPGPELGDYLGLPINDAARMKADAWDASILSLREHQGKPHPATYSLRGPANIRISRILDPVTQATIGWEIFGTFGQATRTIYTDGRARPPSWAPHTWAGFSLGRWVGDGLEVETTHLKVGWIQRNGVAHSDRATMTEHFFRHGDILTAVTVVKDPVYLEEPFVRTSNWVLDPRQDVLRTQFDIVDEVTRHPQGYVPHLLPGSPGFEAKKTEFADKLKLPRDAVRGGAATTRPEYDPTKPRAPASPTTNLLSSVSSVVESFPPTMWHVQGQVWMLVGAGANMAVQIGDEGVLLVDTGRKGVSDDVLKAIRSVTDKPIRIIINTGSDADHAGGNEAIAKVGRWLAGNAPGNGGLPTVTARVIAHERTMTHMSAAKEPFASWPTETFLDDKELFFNGEAIQILHQSGHTDGDAIVFFRRSDVIAAGDVFSTVSYPVIDRARGGSVQGTLEGLNRIIDLAIPKDHEEGGTYIIPGHGRLCDEADVVEYRDMVTIIRDRVMARTEHQTQDYDRRYGSPDSLIAAVAASTPRR